MPQNSGARMGKLKGLNDVHDPLQSLLLLPDHVALLVNEGLLGNLPPHQPLNQSSLANKMVQFIQPLLVPDTLPDWSEDL